MFNALAERKDLFISFGGHSHAAGLSLVQKNIPILLAENKDDFYVDGVFFDILFPEKDFVGHKVSHINNSSLVFRILFGNVSFLFTGDIESATENYILGLEGPLQSSVLKVAHHGSKTSSSHEFISAVSPFVSVISAGEENTFGPPHSELFSRLQKMSSVFVTKDHGDIYISTGGNIEDIL